MLSCSGGGKLSRAVYLDPHPPWYRSIFFLLILLIPNYLNVEMYQLYTESKSNLAVSLSHCFVCLVAGGGGEAVLAPRLKKLFFVLNSSEHGISNPHKN